MYIQTKRLIITEFAPDMAEAVHRQSLDDATRTFVPDEVFETLAEAEEVLRFLTVCRRTGEGPQVCPVLEKDGTFAGYVQAVPLEEAGWEIGYHIGESHRGRGYAAEAVGAFLPVIMEALGIAEIWGICLSENLASRRTLESCGFRKVCEGTSLYQGEARRVCRYFFERLRKAQA